jgi:hypothetical protein
MPKAKFKRKGVPAYLTASPPPPEKRTRTRSEGIAGGSNPAPPSIYENNGEIREASGRVDDPHLFHPDPDPAF